MHCTTANRPSGVDSPLVTELASTSGVTPEQAAPSASDCPEDAATAPDRPDQQTQAVNPDLRCTFCGLSACWTK